MIGGSMSKRIANPLRDAVYDMQLDAEDSERLLEIAEQIDNEHFHRMYQCESDVRKRLCKDVRWAVNLLERCWTRGGIRREIEGDECDE